MPPRIRHCVLPLCFACLPAGAQAAAVTNLTGEAQTVEVLAAGGYMPQVIAPHATWRLQAKVKLRFKDREYRIGEHEEFAIWKDGTFGPQRANMRGGRQF